MKIEFRPNSAYDGHRWGVAFTAYVNHQPRRCLVSDAALNHHFGGDAAKTGDALVQLFENNRARIEQIARALIEDGQTDDIIIGTSDFA